MDNPKYLGSVFMHEYQGDFIKIAYSCKEVPNPTLGVPILTVENINVFDQDNNDISHLVDMEEIKKVCEEKAVITYITHVPPENL